MANYINTGTTAASNSGMRTKRRLFSPAGASGFTLVELLVAILITALASAGIYAIYNNFFRQTATQDMMLEAQQNARVAINIMERELMNAGYNANTPDIITEATANSVEFIYFDPDSLSATYNQRLKVKYSLQTAGGVQYLVRKADNLTTASVGATEQVIPYVNNLTFTFYDINGGGLDPATTLTVQAGRNTVRFVSVNLVTQTKAAPPGSAGPKTFAVETHIRLRNIGVGSVASDATAPAAPAGVEVRDPGVCARLKVKWTQNTEGDLAGYKLYYGTASGSYTGVVNIPLTVMSGSTYSCSNVAGSVECTIFPSGPALVHTPSNAAAGTETIYYLAVKAYDNSLNHSDFSAEVGGNPVPSNPTFGAGANDSTLNPFKPVAVTGLTGANGALEGQVALSWTGYNTAANPDVTGFRIYRSTSPFASYPIDPTQPNIDWIAGEPGSGKPVVVVGATAYTDPGPGLIGCKTYYYAIAPVNCDATLITDEGADPPEKKYAQTDYGATCGDGTAACSAGTGFAAAAGSDTAPGKTTSPASPVLNVRAGWKRVALSLTQPADPDLSQTCIYSNLGNTYPELHTDTGMFPKVMGCYQIDTGATPGAIRLFENDGIFTASFLPPSQSFSFWHNSMTTLTTTPSLLDTGTYSYRAVSFDLCGNGSAITAAQATTTLCGEDPATGEKPPKVTNLSVSCCSSPVSLSWTGVSSDLGQSSTPTNPYDLAGYRIFRSTNAADWSAATLLTPAAPYWGTTFSDTTAADGGTYYYRVVSTDCPYEKVNPPAATIRTDMISDFLHSEQTAAVYPGRIDRDEMCAGGGGCTKDDHREVLTGVDIDNSAGNGTGAASPISEFAHNKVTMFFSNTSAGTMTITGASVAWTNSSAFLREIKIGGGRGGVGPTSTSIATGSTTTVTGNPPYTSAVSNLALTNAAITGGARYVPVTFEFKDISGNRIDMRDDTLLVTLNVRNDSTGATTCLTYLTVSGSSEGIFVPPGPTVTATQQDKPSAPTFSYAVPGATGLNAVPSGSNGAIVVDASASVTVNAAAAGNTTNEVTGTKIPVSSVKLNYVATAKTVTTAPSSGFSVVNMTNTGGNTWSGVIPSNDGMRVWYYILATDSDGNWDRDPEKAEGAYVYDQKSFNVCDVTPNAPTALTATSSGAGPYSIALSWTAPATYTSGASINTGIDPLLYRIFRTTGGVTSQVGTDQASTSYTDPGLAAGVYSYTVKTLNSCAAPGPNVSSNSNVAASCAGASGQATISVSPTSIFRGDSYTVTIVDCLALNGAYASTVETINSTAGFLGHTNTSTAPLTGSINPYNPAIPETGPATGTFTATITTTGNSADTGKLLTLPADTITVFYPFASPSSKTVSVVVDACTNTPKAPTGLSGSVSGSSMTLSWTAVTQNTDNSAITDLAGYRVYEKVCAKGKTNCTGGDIVKDWFVRTTATGTTATVSADQGAINQRIYYFKITAIDTCATPNESGFSGSWNETN